MRGERVWCVFYAVYSRGRFGSDVCSHLNFILHFIHHQVSSTANFIWQLTLAHSSIGFAHSSFRLPSRPGKTNILELCHRIDQRFDTAQSYLCRLGIAFVEAILYVCTSYAGHVPWIINKNTIPSSSVMNVYWNRTNGDIQRKEAGQAEHSISDCCVKLVPVFQMSNEHGWYYFLLDAIPPTCRIVNLCPLDLIFYAHVSSMRRTSLLCALDSILTKFRPPSSVD